LAEGRFGIKRYLRVVLLVLAALVVAFVVTWVSVPSGSSDDVPPPASLFIRGIGTEIHECLKQEPLGGGRFRVRGEQVTVCEEFGPKVVGVRLGSSDLHDLKTRIAVIFGSAAAAVVLVGVAVGAPWRD
jgi:hypothetical protein